MCLIDSSSHTTGCECQFSPSSSPTEPHLKYKYDETVSNRSLVGTGQGDTSLRSLFSSSGKMHRPAPSMTNLNEDQAEVVGDEISSEEIPDSILKTRHLLWGPSFHQRIVKPRHLR